MPGDQSGDQSGDDTGNNSFDDTPEEAEFIIGMYDIDDDPEFVLGSSGHPVSSAMHVARMLARVAHRISENPTILHDDSVLAWGALALIAQYLYSTNPVAHVSATQEDAFSAILMQCSISHDGNGCYPEDSFLTFSTLFRTLRGDASGSDGGDASGSDGEVASDPDGEVA